MVNTSGLIAHSVALRTVEEEARIAAQSDAKVLLTGESGVGKEVIAHLVHRESARKNAPFIVINCAGVPDTLLESELFGHVRGSFTGAFSDKMGLLERAHRGTVFLDEVGEMSVRMQGMLLRFLETGELQRVGGTNKERSVDVRVIAATNRNLFDCTVEGTFRADLYYRLNVIHIPIPPLRERLEDVVPLMNHFLSSYAARAAVTPPVLTEPAQNSLLLYHWPGNVRELRNLAERMVVCGRREVRPDDLNLLPPAGPRGGTSPKVPPSRPRALFDRMVAQGESFWSAVYPAFIERDVTCEDVRTIISMGLAETLGNYKMLLQLFNMRPTDYKRFMNFLRKHQCHVAFQPYRELAEPSGSGVVRSLGRREGTAPSRQSPVS